nr:polysaccharide pyruvyl transferase family protein [Ramlibacter monticola]
MLGIGSVLFDHHPAGVVKVVFGSGYGGYTAPPVLDETWDIFCVRGDFTARTLGLDPSYSVGDSGILIYDYRNPTRTKQHKFSFIPHWESLERGCWKEACRLANVHFIDPTAPVPEVLHAIEASEVVLTEAMHGAIVADALRVPWVPILPFSKAHHVKWNDWASALDVDLRPRPIRASSVQEQLVRWGRSGRRLDGVTGLRRRFLQTLDRRMTERAAESLAMLTNVTPSLSSDESIERAVGRLNERACAILKKYAPHIQR